MKPKVISFNYTLKDSQGQVLDASNGGPLAFLEGSHQIIPALEEQLKTMLIGQKKSVKLAATEAYGLVEPKMIMDVPKADVAHLPVEVGSFLQLQLSDSMKVVRVTQVSDEKVTLDGNHPLAGQDLEFDVEMVDLRDATEEELKHGHAHGAGGHQH